MMRLQNTPPAGAGKSHRGGKTERLLKHIEGLGTDKASFLPIGIRTTDLAEATGVPAASITVLLQKYVDSGRLQMCKVATPGNRAQNEYRKGIGVPIDFKPLNTKRAGIALRGTPRPAAAAPTPLSTPKPAVGEIVTPTFISKTQPEVVAPTPAVGGAPNPPAAEPAVAAQATPKPAAGAALKEEPATRKASAGDDLRIGINDAGTLVIALDDDRIELNQKQAQRLGNFMVGTQGVWSPF